MRRFNKVGLAVALVGAWVALAGIQVFGQTTTAPAGAQTAPLPKLVDVGAKACIPCKKMAPILEELKKELAGKLEVEFIDVSIKENLPLAQKYGVKLIPTQIFFDKEGKELWRHEGFISKEDLLARWKQLGYDFAPATQPAPKAAG